MQILEFLNVKAHILLLLLLLLSLSVKQRDSNFINFGQLRTEVNKVLEVARSGKLIGSSLEAMVYLHTSDDSLAAKFIDMSQSKTDADTLPRIFITSQVEILPSLEHKENEDIPYTGEYLIGGKNKVWIGVSRAKGSKCERCWNFSPQVGSFDEHPSLCSRCYNVIASQPEPALAAVS